MGSQFFVWTHRPPSSTQPPEKPASG